MKIIAALEMVADRLDSVQKKNMGSTFAGTLTVLLDVPKRVSGPDDPDRRRCLRRRLIHSRMPPPNPQEL